MIQWLFCLFFFPFSTIVPRSGGRRHARCFGCLAALCLSRRPVPVWLPSACLETLCLEGLCLSGCPLHVWPVPVWLPSACLAGLCLSGWPVPVCSSVYRFCTCLPVLTVYRVGQSLAFQVTDTSQFLSIVDLSCRSHLPVMYMSFACHIHVIDMSCRNAGNEWAKS